MATWEMHVVWPKCEECRSTGVSVDPKTKWPVECPRCRVGRENAIKKAKAARRKSLKNDEGTA